MTGGTCQNDRYHLSYDRCFCRWLLPPRERDSRIFFFLPPFRANFDDLRPLKAKFDTFEHLWGSKTRFCAPRFFVGFTKNKSIFDPKKIHKIALGGPHPHRSSILGEKMQKNAKIGCLTIWVHQIHGSAVLSHNQFFRAEESDEEFFKKKVQIKKLKRWAGARRAAHLFHLPPSLLARAICRLFPSVATRPRR